MPPFDREKVFAAVDESSKRFEKYTDAERKKFAEDARLEKEWAEEQRRIQESAMLAAIFTIMS